MDLGTMLDPDELEGRVTSQLVRLQRAQKRRRLLKRLLWTGVVLAVVAIAAAIAGYWFGDQIEQTLRESLQKAAVPQAES